MAESIVAKTEVALKAICPACHIGRFGIDHAPGRYGPWGCDECGARWLFDIDMPAVRMTRVDGDNVPSWMVVRIGEGEEPIYAVVGSFFYAHSANDTPEERDNHRRFWVEESTCPTNIVRVDALVVDGDADPHGLLTFVGEVRKADWPGECEPHAGWVAVINAALAAALPAPPEAVKD